jgi:hypothetical protein
MIKRLLFNGIDVDGDWMPVHQTAQAALAVDAGTAPSPLSVFEEAILSTKQTPDIIAVLPARRLLERPFIRVAFCTVLACLGCGDPISRFRGITQKIGTLVEGQQCDRRFFLQKSPEPAMSGQGRAAPTRSILSQPSHKAPAGYHPWILPSVLILLLDDDVNSCDWQQCFVAPAA